MSRTGFSTLAAVIGVRIDTDDRLRNLRIVLDYLLTDFPGLQVVVVEHAEQPAAAEMVRRFPEVSYHYLRGQGCFHKSLVLNFGASVATRPHLLFYDSDVLVNPRSVALALGWVAGGEADFVYPYNGVMLQIRSERVETLQARADFVQDLEVCELDQRPTTVSWLEYLYGERDFPSTGGALLADRVAYFEVGGFNENILSYSCEDVEFSVRASRLKPGRVRYLERANCYHLEHRRGQDSRYNGFHQVNKAEWRRVEEMPLEQLRAYASNRFREFRPQPSDRLTVINRQDQYCLRVSRDPRPPLSDLCFIWAPGSSSRAIKAFDRFMTKLSQEFSDYLVLLVEIGSYRLSERRHQDNLIYLHLPESSQQDWWVQAMAAHQRPTVVLCAGHFDLAALKQQRRPGSAYCFPGAGGPGALLIDRAGSELAHPKLPLDSSLPELRTQLVEQGLIVEGDLQQPEVEISRFLRRWKGKVVASAGRLLEGWRDGWDRGLRRLRERLPGRPVQLPKSSLVVTTHRGHTLMTQACLERVARWKQDHHELVVVVHDESPLLGAYLRSLVRRGVIDRLLPAVSDHGHLAGVNLGFAQASGEVVFNLCVDTFLGPGLLDRCARRLWRDPRVGLIGWHYNWAPHHDGTFWHGERLEYTARLRDAWMEREGQVNPRELIAICSAPWYTGRTLRAVGNRRILSVNGSFFGIRRQYWERVGGFDHITFEHMWADDFLCYALLDQGLNILNLPADVRCSQRPGVFESRSDLKWEGRDDPLYDRDELVLPGAEVTGLGRDDSNLLRVSLDSLESGAAVAILGHTPVAAEEVQTLTSAPVRGFSEVEGKLDVLLVGDGQWSDELRPRLKEDGVALLFDQQGTERALRVVRAEGERLRFGSA